MSAPGPGTRWGVTLLRVAVASVFVVHGTARAAVGGVEPFGAFLSSVGVPGGVVIAWLLTLVEIVGGITLALGVAVRFLAAWFGVQIAAGIAMVHAQAGWFVVGLGRNGAEYSALIVICLAVVALTDAASYAVRRPSEVDR